VTVADGAHASRLAAQAAVDRLLQRARSNPSEEAAA